MPEEIFIIVIIAIMSGTLLGVVSNVRQYLETKNAGKGEQSGSSMRTSELEAMMERAAQKAIRPLVKRVENIEAVMADEDLPDLLTDADTYFESDPIKSRIKVTRSEDSKR